MSLINQFRLMFLDGQSITFTSVLEDYIYAYFDYCVQNRIVPQRIISFEKKEWPVKDEVLDDQVY